MYTVWERAQKNEKIPRRMKAFGCFSRNRNTKTMFNASAFMVFLILFFSDESSAPESTTNAGKCWSY